MRTLIHCFAIFCFLSACSGGVGNESKGISQETKLEKLCTNFSFTEGPASDKIGNVYFTDIPNNLILIWSVDDVLDTFRINSQGANGLYFDINQNLLVCQGSDGTVTLTDSIATVRVIADKYEGKRFNQPNDLWADKKGGVYFTDPEYADEPTLPQNGMHVYYISNTRDTIIKVCNDFKKPNGIIGNPEKRTLYISDQEANKTYKYTIMADGTLSKKSLFVAVGSDGMTIDTAANIYLTPNDQFTVDVYAPDGTRIRSIEIPEKPNNVCFGGRNRNQLFITAGTSLYRIILNSRGLD